MSDLSLAVYGCRGSMPVSRPSGSRYGNNTTCITIEADSTRLIMDAGSGLNSLYHESYSPTQVEDIHLILSHLHLDHVGGLGMFYPATSSSFNLNIYTTSHNNKPLAEQVFGLFKPPYWPIELPTLAKATYHQISPDKPFYIEPFTITPFNAPHPDNTLSFHIRHSSGKSVVYLLDSEIPLMTKKHYAELVEACNGADVVVFDCAYSNEDYPSCKGYGHSPPRAGEMLLHDSNCKKILFSHFSQKYSDDELDSWSEEITTNKERFVFAQEGMVLKI